VDDFELDMLGASGSMLIILAVYRRRELRFQVRWLMVISGALLALVGMWPLVTMSAAYLERNEQRPVILSFDSRFGDTFRLMQNAALRIERNDDTGLNRARIMLGDGPWPGIILHDIWPDWSSYSKVIVDLELPGGSPLTINVRIHDLEHRNGKQPYSDRFNRSFRLAQGEHEISIPLADIRKAPEDRELNLHEIDGFVIFCSQRDAGKEFILGRIRLE
jgi:hypothetical protein